MRYKMTPPCQNSVEKRTSGKELPAKNYFYNYVALWWIGPTTLLAPSYHHEEPLYSLFHTPSAISLSSSSAIPSLPLTPSFFACLPSLLLQFFGPSCFRTLAAFVVVVRSEPRFLFRTYRHICWCDTSAHDQLALQSF